MRGESIELSIVSPKSRRNPEIRPENYGENWAEFFNEISDEI
jgi:hypothetical protein